MMFKKDLERAREIVGDRECPELEERWEKLEREEAASS